MKSGKYRTTFHSPLSPTDAFRAARDEMRAWLRGKSYSLTAFDRGEPSVSPSAVLLRNSANSADGTQTERWQLVEHRPQGAWLSALTVQAPAKARGSAATWFWVEVEFSASDDEPATTGSIRASVPRLARGLVNAVQAFDSLAQLTAQPVIINRERVDDLIDVLCDPDRRYPAVVASAHPTIGFEEWKLTIERVMYYLPGIASMYLLDPLSERTLERAIGSEHAVRGGALRTYMPEVDPAVAEDAVRHRVLSGKRIAADPGRAAAIVSALPRRLAAEAPLPPALAGVNRALLTQARGTSQTADVAELRSQVEQLAQDREIALQLAEEQEERANSLFTQRETALAELAEREQRVLYLDSQVRALRQRLVAVGKHREAFQPADETPAPPTTFAELIEWLENDVARISFTGSIQAPLSLDQNPEASTWVRSSWEVLLAMQAFARAKAEHSFEGDFRTWCESPPSGAYAIPAGKVARDESERVRTNAKWRRLREFPVPESVSPSGRTFMGAHVRIGASAAGRISPRLYFLDAIARAGVIYVGYLGRHLPNTRT